MSHIFFADGLPLLLELFTRKPKPFKVSIKPRSDAILQVIQQTAKEACTDIPDVDSIEMATK